jgi:DNA repair exonuclease SbcCD ATPase subunit
VKYSESTSKLRKLGTLRGKISQKIKSIVDEHRFFSDNNVCPTCTQNIDEQFRLSKIDSTRNKSKELQSGYDELKNAIVEEEKREIKFNNLTKEISKITNEISKNNTKISTYQKQIRDLQSEIQKNTNQIKNQNNEHIKLEEFKNSLITVFGEISSKKDQMQKYDFIQSLLTDSGVKSKIIKKYLPLINQQVNRFLQIMDSYINFVLDEEFNETVESPIYEDFSYSSFSEGEKARINLSLIFAWREVARMKNSTNCNIILFDEVFDGSLDSTGTEDFLKIIRFILKDTSVFVISHKSGLEDKFESVYKAEKNKGFSRIVKL